MVMRVMQVLDEIFYSLGLLGLVAGALVKLGLVDSWVLLNTAPRGFAIFAGTMFLAVLATRAITGEGSNTG